MGIINHCWLFQSSKATGEHPLIRSATGFSEAHRLLPQITLWWRPSRLVACLINHHLGNEYLELISSICDVGRVKRKKNRRAEGGGGDDEDED